MKINAIEVKDLTVIKESGEPIFQDISFAIKKGESVVLTGASGCGKSTILRTILGGSHNWSGSVSVNSIPLTPKEIKQLRNEVSYIPQQPRFPQITVREYIHEVLSFQSNSRRDDSQLDHFFELLSLPMTLLESNCSRLSGGERQRVATVMPLLLDRPILLADEITSALDTVSKKALVDHLFSLDKTILSVSHDPQWIEKCDRSIVIGEYNG